MEIHADWKDCSIEDFVELNKDDLIFLNLILSDYLNSANKPAGHRATYTLQAKLLFRIHNTF